MIAALALVRPWRARRAVMSIHVGHRSRGGRYPAAAEAEVGLVVNVAAKLSPTALARLNRKVFPPAILVEGRWVPVDVQESGGQGRFESMVGRQVDAGPTPLRGAVGLVVERGGAKFLLTAAHVAQQEQWSVVTHQGPAVVARRWFGDRLDHALLEVQGPLSSTAAHLRDGSQLTGVRAVDFQLVGAEVLLFHADNGRVDATTVRDVGVTYPFQGTQFRGLIRTDACSRAGDSGTLLFDRCRRAIGTLVGRTDHHSFFLPCDTSLARLHATPIC
ncbi:MAG: trypsin-like peptidase domain-containing protein [Myxococcota bacterium]